MPATMTRPRSPLFRGLFPDWSGPRPVSFFLMEQLLEARSESPFPTNGAGPDEDVNVYLAGLLTRFMAGEADPRVGPGMDPLFHPPARTAPRALRAEWYRVNGDHRLICQGLFDRGENLRRRRVPFGFSEVEARRRDRAAGEFCYRAAADLLEDRAAAPSGLVAVLRKLEHHYEDYLQVLTVLATRRLGLGARLTETQLAMLFRSSPEEVGTAEPRPAMDDLLDLLSIHRRDKSPAIESRMRALAGALGVDTNLLPVGPGPA